jgi:hypothetical protein
LAGFKIRKGEIFKRVAVDTLAMLVGNCGAARSLFSRHRVHACRASRAGAAGLMRRGCCSGTVCGKRGGCPGRH